MVSVGKLPGQTPLFNDMIIPPKRERPSTANTMVLVLRPPSEDFKQMAQLTGSETERNAHRKNRVMQMKLSAYLAEVCQQQKSSARLHKTEEYRFLQEVERRSSVPRSVNMLHQLQQFTRRTFPDAPYSYVDEMSVNSRATSAVHRPSLPLSARGPARGLRASRQMLDRPRTSAPVLRHTPVEEESTSPGEGESTVSLPRQPQPSIGNAVLNKLYSAPTFRHRWHSGRRSPNIGNIRKNVTLAILGVGGTMGGKTRWYLQGCFCRGSSSFTGYLWPDKGPENLRSSSFHNKVISSFQAFRQVRAPVAGFKPATEESMQISGRTPSLCATDALVLRPELTCGFKLWLSTI
ncbi:hypothetical protein PoB_002814400 [Plakobranchus ocellatus]|uniref:Uncharacterized protein n=1 Tax=Plakobranchus ocellatus TaxID=259542 RepID=A0AAV4A1Y7_9GAST|nr:hypothetical protein PoB_002814400 [Plakobranchus ocellatus]